MWGMCAQTRFGQIFFLFTFLWRVCLTSKSVTTTLKAITRSFDLSYQNSYTDYLEVVQLDFKLVMVYKIFQQRKHSALILATDYGEFAKLVFLEIFLKLRSVISPSIPPKALKLHKGFALPPPPSKHPRLAFGDNAWIKNWIHFFFF